MLGLIAGALMTAKAALTRPHIIFILADDLGWNDVSFHGSTQIPTPNIDNFARSGQMLNNYYVNPVCSPTRASLLTGRSIIHHGIYSPFGQGQKSEGLNLTYTLLPQHLKQNYGYHNYMVGKWHLGIKSKDYLPTMRGFDRYYGYYQGVTDYWSHNTTWDAASSGVDIHYGGADIEAAGKEDPVWGTDGEYSTFLFARKANEWITEHAKTKPDVPMFMYIPLQNIHSGDNRYVQAPSDYIDKFSDIAKDTCPQYSLNCTKAAMRKSVAAAVSVLDDAVGNILSAIKAAGILDKTIITFSTDNGGPTDGADANNANNYPLRGCKGGYFEGGVRAVGAINGPGIPIGENNELLHVTDFFASFLTAAKRGLPTKGEKEKKNDHHELQYRAGEKALEPADGVDNWDALSGHGPSARTEILHVTQAKGSVFKSHAIRAQDLKLVINPEQSDCSQNHPGWYPPPSQDVSKTKYTIKCPTHPPVFECTDASPCLFNITADPCEQVNLATKLPQQVDALRQRIQVLGKNTVLSWANFAQTDARANPKNFGGVWTPWMTSNEAQTYYPSNYSGPPYSEHIPTFVPDLLSSLYEQS